MHEVLYGQVALGAVSESGERGEVALDVGEELCVGLVIVVGREAIVALALSATALISASSAHGNDARGLVSDGTPNSCV